MTILKNTLASLQLYNYAKEKTLEAYKLVISV